ncbi:MULTISPECIES: GNAT family N-acetyltransferase [Actinoplanes]|uniref:GNAT family N-acetyltransferase n=1 Tax=Actinoplanes TaxID=1865 RepID=UPI000697F653|nr:MULTISPECIES: GNAT family N-acetyltransferase [Actinoplanes]
MTIRRATIADAAALAHVHVRGWQAAYHGLMPQDHLDGLDVAEREVRWRGWLAGDHPSIAVLVWEDADGVVGGFVNVAAGPDATGEVNALYLLPEHWDRGAGRRLLADGLRVLAAAGCDTATLWVLDTNRRARRFYEIGGWRPDGATRIDDSLGLSLPETRYRRELDGQGLRPTAA